MQKIILELSDTCMQHVRESAEKSGMTVEHYVAACIWRTVPHTMTREEKTESQQLMLFDLYKHYV